MKRKRTLRQRLEKEKVRLGKIALRDPRTNEQLLTRIRWDRVLNIMWKRYERKETARGQ